MSQKYKLMGNTNAPQNCYLFYVQFKKLLSIREVCLPYTLHPFYSIDLTQLSMCAISVGPTLQLILSPTH